MLRGTLAQRGDPLSGAGVPGCPYLLKLVGNHGKSLEDGIRRARDGHDSFWAVAFRDVDPCPALEGGEQTPEMRTLGRRGGPTDHPGYHALAAGDLILACPRGAPEPRVHVGAPSWSRPRGAACSAAKGPRPPPSRRPGPGRVSAPLTSSRIFFTVSPFWNKGSDKGGGVTRAPTPSLPGWGSVPDTHESPAHPATWRRSPQLRPGHGLNECWAGLAPGT